MVLLIRVCITCAVPEIGINNPVRTKDNPYYPQPNIYGWMSTESVQRTHPADKSGPLAIGDRVEVETNIGTEEGEIVDLDVGEKSELVEVHVERPDEEGLLSCGDDFEVVSLTVPEGSLFNFAWENRFRN